MAFDYQLGGAARSTQPTMDFDSAGWWQRVGASLLDGLLLLVVGVVVAIPTRADSGSALNLVVSLASIFYAPLMLAYNDGRTLGCMALGIRVINADGAPIGLGRALVREVVVKGVFAVLFPLMILSVLWPLWQEHKRTLYDLLVKTRVVET